MHDATCSYADCPEPVHAKGWCKIHYGRWRKHGDPGRVDKPGLKPRPVTKCLIKDCPKPARTRNWCWTHYKNWLRYGDPLGPVVLREDLPGERWRDVQGYEGLYQISDLGRVWSSRRRGSTGHILKPWVNPKGYPTVTLSRDDVDESWDVHRLVADAFLGPRLPGQVTRHGPNGAGDPSVANLCYGTPAENEQDKVRDGTSNRGERNGQAKLTEGQVVEIRRRYGDGESRYSIARDFGISGGYVSELADGSRWGLPVVVRTATGHVRGEGQHTAKLTAEIVLECRARRTATGESYYSMAIEYGVTRAVMREAVLGVTWKHL